MCPECLSFDGTFVMVIPHFLIPGRRYPIFVYLYAISLYSANPEMGQRKAAEMTRKLFGLATFAHTTLGRALKKLCQLIRQYVGKESISTNTDPDYQEEPMEKKALKCTFPTVLSTKTHRELISVFLNDLYTLSNRAEIEKACREIVARWYDKNRCLLL